MGDGSDPTVVEPTNGAEDGLVLSPDRASEHSGSTEPATPPPRPSPPWHLHPYLAIGLLVSGIVLGVVGFTRFAAAGSEGELEMTALEEFAALEAEEAGLLTDAEAVRGDIAATEADTRDSRDRMSVTEAEIAATEAEIAATGAEIIDVEEPIRFLQAAAWEMYSALQQASDTEGRLTADIEGAVAIGNVRNVDGMNGRLENLQSDLLAALNGELGAVDRAVADTRIMLSRNGASFEITEDFESEPMGWEAGFASNGVAEPADGGYWVTAADPLVLMWGVSPYEIADVLVEVTAQATSGDHTEGFAFGVLCRAEQTSYLSGYVFAVTADGGFMVGWYEPPGDWVDLAFGSSDAVNGGLEANRISVTCNGPELSFSVNGTLVWEGYDSNLAEGSIALGAWTYGDEPVTVRFDDLLLRSGYSGEGGG